MGKRQTWLLAMLLVALWSRLGHADLNGAEFKSDEWKVKLSTPRGWQVNDHSTYPGILLWMLRHDPNARMLFSAEVITAKMKHGKNTQTYAIETAKRLESLGFSVRAPQLHSATGAFWMDFDDGKRFLRQAVLLPSGHGFAYTLTLSTNGLRLRSQLLRVFDYALRSIKPTK